jgi:diguanylate cyclase (GGDEF)-like protein
MKIQGTFLSSRAGRRIFWTLLLAAAVPLGLFGAATYNALVDHFQSQWARQRLQLAKLAGMGVLDRLVVARTVLEITARTGKADADSSIGNRRGRVLVAAAQLDAQGRYTGGDADLWRRWRDAQSDWRSTQRDDAAKLLLGHHLAREHGLPVLIVVRAPGAAAGLWIGEIDDDFLFSELSAKANGERICVFDAHVHPVFCPAPDSADESTAPASAATRPTSDWKLFLRSDFGIEDWTITRFDAPGMAAAGPDSMARNAALGAVASLLFVVMLSLMLVRRTMVPLEQLILGTRRLSNRDYAARVQLHQDDEFGELAQSFNHMAERIGSQVQAMQVQSAIDREILNGLDVARVLQQVARRLEQLVPGAEACVVELDLESRNLARVHRSAGPWALAGVPLADALCMAQAPDGENLVCEEPPRWLLQTMRQPMPRALARCAKDGDRLMGLLVLGHDGQPLDSPEILREIVELCDRVSVTLLSADRERRLLERATRDSLTGLCNRSGLYEDLEARLARATAQPFTVLFIDLDGFKEVNDSRGHQVGDELLRAVAQRLRSCAPPGAVVARPGGDEFVLVVPGAKSAADAFAQVLCVQLAAPVPLDGHSVVVGASIGMAHHPVDGLSSSDLMRRADMAMYSAKARGGGVATWFVSSLDERLAERTALLADLRLAVERREFELHYQPRINVRSGALSSAEALLRWHHPTRGLVQPTHFIDLLEETGLIDTIGMWAIDEACRQLMRWRSQGLKLETIAVNLSTRQLHAADFVEQLMALLRLHDVPPSSLELEVTESIFMGDSAAAIQVLERLQRAGLRIALDDFGTGYSSLSYLHKLPIGVLKVDRSFVMELSVRDSALALTRSIVALARALGMRVVAEGVETRQQADLLVELGCDELQGYLFSPALPASALIEYAQAREHADVAEAPLG